MKLNMFPDLTQLAHILEKLYDLLQAIKTRRSRN